MGTTYVSNIKRTRYVLPWFQWYVLEREGSRNGTFRKPGTFYKTITVLSVPITSTLSYYLAATAAGTHTVTVVRARCARRCSRSAAPWTVRAHGTRHRRGHGCNTANACAQHLQYQVLRLVSDSAYLRHAMPEVLHASEVRSDVWDLAGANTHRHGVGVGTRVSHSVRSHTMPFAYGLKSLVSPVDTSSHLLHHAVVLHSSCDA